MSDKVFMFLGLARRANAVILGEEAVKKAVQNRKVSLVIVAKDASQNTKDGVIRKCEYHHVVYRSIGFKEIIGKHMGKNVVAVVGVKNKEFSKKLIEMIEDI